MNKRRKENLILVEFWYPEFKLLEKCPSARCMSYKLSSFFLRKVRKQIWMDKWTVFGAVTYVYTML
jgi:hypothetical protein